jgi:DNA-binding LacI/PurR family transcriptional regulator
MGVPTATMGRTAVEVLLRHIEASGEHEPEVINLQPELTERASTAPAPEAVTASNNA